MYNVMLFLLSGNVTVLGMKAASGLRLTGDTAVSIGSSVLCRFSAYSPCTACDMRWPWRSRLMPIGPMA